MKRAALLLVLAIFWAWPSVSVAQPKPRAMVVETASVGADAALSVFVNQRIHKTVEKLGYSPLFGRQVARAVAALGPRRLDARDVLSLARELGAARGVYATLGRSAGRYSVTVIVVSADGAGPWQVTGEATAEQLPSTVDQLVRSSLPSPGASVPSPHGVELASPDDAGLAPSFARWRLAFQTEAAFGLQERFFYNHLVGAHLDYRFTETVSFGGYVGYANLRGRDGRASNVLPYFLLEYRPRPFLSDAVGLPLRYATGYLTNNGPFVRFSAGVSFDVSESVDITLDLIAPTWWFNDNLAVFSLDAALEVGIKL